MSIDAAPARKRVVERIRDLLPRVEYRRIVEACDLEAIFRLRHDAYLREGAIERREDGKLQDPFDAAPNCYQFGVYVDGELASSLRIHVLSVLHASSPASEAFSDYLAEELTAGKTVIDPNRFAVDFASSRLFPELPFLTLRLAYMAAVHFEADVVTATVRREHQAFYRRELLMAPRCPPRAYPTLTKELGLMTIDFARDGADVVRRRPYYDSTQLERESLFARLLPAEGFWTTRRRAESGEVGRSLSRPSQAAASVRRCSEGRAA
jgi:hypothetical protein